MVASWFHEVPAHGMTTDGMKGSQPMKREPMPAGEMQSNPSTPAGVLVSLRSATATVLVEASRDLPDRMDSRGAMHGCNSAI